MGQVRYEIQEELHEKIDKNETRWSIAVGGSGMSQDCVEA